MLTLSVGGTAGVGRAAGVVPSGALLGYAEQASEAQPTAPSHRPPHLSHIPAAQALLLADLIGGW
ncbi:MAG: hypothetical protein Q4G30_01715 [Actinomycetaceae bacterium]|nr:hypothetical protein [Actinomycetaceae bacterium]